MGLSQEQAPRDESTFASSSAPTSELPKDTSALPTAALDLASTLFSLARSGATAQLHQYIAAGIPPNLTNHKGDTLLMLAAYHGHSDTVEMLLDRGADADALNDRGQSPLAGAVFKGHGAVVSVLVAAGADVNAGQPSASEAATMFRREEMVRLLERRREVDGDASRGRA